MSWEVVLDMRQVQKIMHVLGCLSLLILVVGSSQGKTLKVGDVAPELATSALVQGEAVSNFERGTVYVIEFWATWCGSCHAAMPHLNQLAEAMKGRPVKFVSISNEQKKEVAEMLKVKPSKLAVALDDEGKTFGSYGVKVIPHTIVVDGTGKLAAITMPEKVTAEALENVLAGKAIDLPVKSNVTANLDWDKTLLDASVSHCILERSDSVSGASKFAPGSGQIVGDGLGLSNMIQLAYGSNYQNTQLNISSPHRGPYRVSVKAADGKDDTARAMLRAMLHGSFEFKAEWKEVEKKLPVLRYDASKAGSGLKKSTTEGKADGFARGGSIKMERVTLAAIAETIGAFALGKSMIDETGLTGVYDVDLTWTPGDKASFEAALAKAGLSYSMEIRKTKELVVEPKTL